MSDFDKEAERERLREKYEREQEKREATERMSELLLKGATMTNAHCEHCGDPIFRYDGDEFCPTCQQMVQTDVEADEQGADEQGADEATRQESEATEAGAARADTAADDASDQADADDGTPDTIEMKRPTGPVAGDAADANGQPEGTGGADSPEGQAAAPQRGGQPGGQPGAETGSQPSPGSGTGVPAGESGDPLADARASLTRALLTHARQAEQTSDPRRAQDHLSAAREAAEALAALY